MSLLPDPADEDAWDALLADDAALAPRVRSILEHHGLQHEALDRYDSGSLPVYAVGASRVLKLFPPFEAEYAHTEARALAAVQDALPLPTPRLVAAEQHEGWPYLLMSRLHGERLVDAWARLTAAERDRLADRLGEAVAALHAIPTAPLAGLGPDWTAFAAVQRASAAQRQRERRLAPQWVEQVDSFLERWMPAPPTREVLLHTELMREHLLVDVHGEASGLFDFEPAMLGAPEYDFSSFGLFVSCGDPRFLRRALLAYGYAPHQLDAALPCRLMAHTLLHRYSHLRWYLDRLPPRPGATTLEALAAQWWAFEETT